VPNPAFALRTVLDKVMGGAAECLQEAFFTRLADALPVIDGGVYRRSVEASLRGIPQLRMNEVSVSLSLALLHLEAAGAVRLETRADAPKRQLLGRQRRQLRSVSHIVRLVSA
jgi:hypothetical protein